MANSVLAKSVAAKSGVAKSGVASSSGQVPDAEVNRQWLYSMPIIEAATTQNASRVRAVTSLLVISMINASIQNSIVD
ncbi:MAG: hypothetical protein DHS20C08_24810 [Rhodomicrobium sp.]|nr:MAG: hypothetical protein DHS20C08_24810 [Rhodomicrobium sp.]